MGSAAFGANPSLFFNGALNDNAYALWAAKIIVVFAIGQGIAEDDARRWIQQLEDADKEGRFGFVSVPILTSAIAI